MSNNNSTTGVTGNTNIPQQQHAAAGSSATVNRVKSFAKNNKVLVGALALVAIYTVITVFTSNDVGLGGLLVTLFLLRYAHKQYEKNSKPTVSSLIGHLIAATIALVIIASPLVQKPLEGFNWAIRELGEVDVAAAIEGCPGSFSANDQIVVRRGCTAEVTGFPAGSEFHPQDARFSESLTVYVDMEQPYPGYIRLTPSEGFPADVNEVKLRVVSAEEARRIATVRAGGTYTPSAAEIEAIRAAAGQ